MCWDRSSQERVKPQCWVLQRVFAQLFLSPGFLQRTKPFQRHFCIATCLTEMRRTCRKCWKAQACCWSHCMHLDGEVGALDVLTGLVRRVEKGSSFGCPDQNITGWPACAANQETELLLGSTLIGETRWKVWQRGSWQRFSSSRSSSENYTSHPAPCCCSWRGATLGSCPLCSTWSWGFSSSTWTTMAALPGILDQTGGADQALQQEDSQWTVLALLLFRARQPCCRVCGVVGPLGHALLPLHMDIKDEGDAYP